MDSVLRFPEQANHHKNEENLSTVKGQLERHMEEEVSFSFRYVLTAASS